MLPYPTSRSLFPRRASICCISSKAGSVRIRGCRTDPDFYYFPPPNHCRPLLFLPRKSINIDWDYHLQLPKHSEGWITYTLYIEYGSFFCLELHHLDHLIDEPIVCAWKMKQNSTLPAKRVFCRDGCKSVEYPDRPVAFADWVEMNVQQGSQWLTFVIWVVMVPFTATWPQRRRCRVCFIPELHLTKEVIQSIANI